MNYRFLPAAIIALVLSGCAPSASSSIIDEIDLDDALPNAIDIGETIDLDEESQLSGVNWSIDDELVATLDGSSLSGLSKGVVKVTATLDSNQEVSASKYINVSAIDGLSIAFSRSTSSIRVGDSYRFEATLTGDVEDKTVSYQVSNDALASIDEDGTLHALKTGSITVTAYSRFSPSSAATSLSLDIVASGTTTEVEGIETWGDGYKLVYKDDFLGNRLNLSSWEVMTGNGSAYDNPGWGNDEEQFYREDNLKVQDGELIITAKRADSDENLGQNYTSGRIRSAKKVAFTYGYIEARVSCPFGNGLWPAFWMLPENETIQAYGGWPNSGEIDILEAKGRLHYSVDGTIHYATPEGEHTYSNFPYTFPDGEDISGYHTYGVLWEEGSLSWYVDGNCYGTFDKDNDPWTMKTGTGEFPAPFDKPFHMLLNMAVGGNYDGYRLPSDAELPARMRISHVKWFQR